MEPLTLHKIETGLRNSINRLDQLTHEIAEAGDAAARTEADYKVAFASARLETRASLISRGERVTADPVDDAATVATRDQHLAHLIARARLDALHKAQLAERTKSDDMRSLLVSYRDAGG